MHMIKTNIEKFKKLHTKKITGLILLTSLFLFVGYSLFPTNDVYSDTLTNGMDAAYVIGAGSATQDFTEDGFATSNIAVTAPNDVEIDATNNRLFVADTYSNRVLVFNLGSDLLPVDYQADFVLGQANFTSGSANRGGAVADNTLSQPGGLDFDNTNNLLYVADSSNKRVLVYNVASITNGESAVSVLGQLDFVSSSATTTAIGLSNPNDITLDEDNNLLYVADFGNNRVLQYNVASITNGEAATKVLGQADFVSGDANRGGSAGQNTMRRPINLALDSVNDYLYVTEQENKRITIYDVNAITDGENAINVLGQADFTSTGAGSITASTLNSPSGAVLGDNLFFVSDTNRLRVLIFDITAITNGEDAVNVLGQANFTSAANLGASATEFLAGGMDYNADSDILYTTDAFYNRVLIFDLSASVPVVTSSGGQQYVEPPQCNLQSPATVTNGEALTLNWNITWPGQFQSSYYYKLNGEVYSPQVQGISLLPGDPLYPNPSQTFTLDAINLYGSTTCEKTVQLTQPQVIDEETTVDETTEETTTEEESPAVETPESEIKACTPYLSSYIKLGSENNKEDVIKLEAFLNTYENENLEIDGVYEKTDYRAVVRFQEKYRDSVLKPWKLIKEGDTYTYVPEYQDKVFKILSKGTGHVYISTRAQINKMYCESND